VLRKAAKSLLQEHRMGVLSSVGDFGKYEEVIKVSYKIDLTSHFLHGPQLKIFSIEMNDFP
jgi:hypothetical protein